MTQETDPLRCATMAEVRETVDAIDRQLVDLLARRFRCMDAAARIKPDRALVRDEHRKAEVLARVREQALCAGIDPELVAGLYDQLVEASIAHELAEFDRLRS